MLTTIMVSEDQELPKGSSTQKLPHGKEALVGFNTDSRSAEDDYSIMKRTVRQHIPGGADSKAR